MRATPFAQQLAQPVSTALRLVQATLQQQAGFEPRSSARVFRFYMSDIGEMVFLPGLLQRVKGEAPGVKIEVAQLPVKEIHAALEGGELDLAVVICPASEPGYAASACFASTMSACCARTTRA